MHHSNFCLCHHLTLSLCVSCLSVSSLLIRMLVIGNLRLILLQYDKVYKDCVSEKSHILRFGGNTI